ncbi:anthocyanidin 3-O-glucosyltransferase 5-like [Quercus lobata]|uniref:Glycosyltransferase n=1 Tax=Quercus lobata TaxID=97700 RepID=A0A7N2MID0_QUELO|nr:anthocyanidin 3-O-glucosyltransferase 5-like [Quercus lobata]
METSKAHVALLPLPGMGHMIPFLGLGKLFVTHHNFKVTIFLVSIDHSSQTLSKTIISEMSNELCNIVQLPPVDITGVVDPNATVGLRLSVTMREIVPAFRSSVATMKPCPTVLITDIFGTDAFSVAEEFGMLKYVFSPSNAWILALTIYTPVLDKEVKGEYVHQKEPLKIPGCASVRVEDLFDPLLDRTNQQYDEYLHAGIRLRTSDGVLMNCWEELQPKTVAALRDDKLLGCVLKRPVYPVGPIVTQSGNSSKSGLLFDWLNKQSNDSVVYVSFGSGATLSHEQMTELAFGLELSQQRFVWVVRAPTKESGNKTYLKGRSGDENHDQFGYLPNGFMSRIQNVGFVISDWVSQVDILSHPSIGAFISHCGWNSTLESILMGVPIIAFPLFAEQKMNATMLTEEFGMAVRLEVLPSKKVVGREEIQKKVRKIMVDNEGHGIRDRVNELKYSAKEALCKGSSSYKALSELAKRFEARMQLQNKKAPSPITHE